MKLRQGTVVDKSNLKRVKLFLLANQVDLFLALKVNLLKVQYAILVRVPVRMPNLKNQSLFCGLSYTLTLSRTNSEIANI